MKDILLSEYYSDWADEYEKVAADQLEKSKFWSAKRPITRNKHNSGILSPAGEKAQFYYNIYVDCMSTAHSLRKKAEHWRLKEINN